MHHTRANAANIGGLIAGFGVLLLSQICDNRIGRLSCLPLLSLDRKHRFDLDGDTPRQIFAPARKIKLFGKPFWVSAHTHRARHLAWEASADCCLKNAANQRLPAYEAGGLAISQTLQIASRFAMRRRPVSDRFITNAGTGNTNKTPTPDAQSVQSTHPHRIVKQRRIHDN